ncbi:hypothetical protein LCGC14_1984610 [marine sediment metagenome]|uniref:Uncharacterized protein n=1 Tax=marine sediment metagenome TaxID=412755 RepID=A0A0F9F840_9ZZZZ
MWSFIASILVFFHLALKLAHYTYEWFAARRGSNILIDIQRHRLRSRKTEKLIQIQKDINLIKNHLRIEKE